MLTVFLICFLRRQTGMVSLSAAALAKFDGKVYLHRCLQHCKTNIRMEASRRDSKTGENAELLGPIIEWTEFSAWLPSDLEFSVFWTSILTRMSSQQLDRVSCQLSERFVKRWSLT